MTPYLIVGFAAFVITYVTTPLVIWGAKKLGAIDHPNDRKVHATPTPTLGGIAIFLAVIGALGLASFMSDFDGVFRQSSYVLGVVAGAVVIFALGAVDDLRDLPAPVKLAGQVFASGILFLAGVKMQFVIVPGGNTLITFGDDVSVLVTVIWLVVMINAVNLIDGLDGLAAGIVAIAAAAFFVYTYQVSASGGLPIASAAPAPLIAITLVGATLAFLRYNFHPAKIFMGDSGSMMLGLVLGGATILGTSTFTSPIAITDSNAATFVAYFPLIIPLLVLAIPVLDAAFAIVRRARRRRSVFHADKEHIHHRLMDLGHGHRKAVVAMYLWSALAAGAGLAFTFLDRAEIVFALPIAVGAIVLYTLFPILTKAAQNRLHP
ncbi:MAG: UDP-GlcNAc:undecaprenyl-phosphate/decaprenyl-phosphate GlcNAc-phosphate transferase [Actinomycetota bacterium]|nr:UDP-GlcNAc:undecaprenyl-phosphate/decaprenyl-phosphate GlcNAc-phosphate transferase [Actinomycetota bacterium]